MKPMWVRFDRVGNVEVSGMLETRNGKEIVRVRVEKMFKCVTAKFNVTSN